MPGLDQLPVEEEMLRGFLRLPPARRRDLRARMHRLSLSRGLTYQKRAGVTEAMNLVPVPAVLPVPEARRVARLCRAIIAALKRIVPRYPALPALRRALPLQPREESWIMDCWHPAHAARQPIIYRLDADMRLAAPRAADSARFFESNSVAVGGMLYGPVAESILADAVLRAIFPRGAPPSLSRYDDTRGIVLGMLADHARACGRKGLTIAVLEDRRWETGITEMPSLVSFFRRSGLRAFLADPGELELRGKEVCVRGRAEDVAYRNFELRDLFDRGDAESGLAALRELFRRNLVVSSMSGDFDHKSLWEVFTSEEFSPLFRPGERALFLRHIPWTRLLYGRRTSDPAGRRVDLPRFVRAERARLVLKPNRRCGGEGVLLGTEATRAEWEGTLARAMGEPGEWVVQEHVDNTVKSLPRPRRGGAWRARPLYTTYGFIATPRGFGIVGRACERRIVNIASGGALLPVFAWGG